VNFEVVEGWRRVSTEARALLKDDSPLMLVRWLHQ